MSRKREELQDPRSTADKARADLRANAAMDFASMPGSGAPRPSVTPETFGESPGTKKDNAPTRAKE